MKICVNVLIEREAPIENAFDFMSSFSKTDGDFSVRIINNTKSRICKTDFTEEFKDIEVMWNNIDPGFVISTNQSLYNSRNFDYSFCINSSYALVVDADWMKDAISDLGSGALGGCLSPIKMSNSEKVQKILYYLSPSSIEWLSKWVNRYMVVPCVNRNAFLINNSFLENIKMPSSKYCEDQMYGLAMTLSFMKNGNSPTSLKSIYASDVDRCRNDIFPIIKQGAGLICPVVIDSVRRRLMK
jgi:hypothetical protein